MSAMRTAIALAALLTATMSFGPAFGQASDVNGGINATRAVNVEDTNIKPVVPADTSEGAAEEMRLAGHCDKAVPLLRDYATRGDGYEISQFNLGMCLLDLAAGRRDAAQKEAMQKEAAQWILRAANGGFARAQAEAVVLDLDGIGVAADPIEAGKWSILYRQNGTRMAIGMQDIAQTVRDRLDAALSDDGRKQARRRADDWTDESQK